MLGGNRNGGSYRPGGGGAYSYQRGGRFVRQVPMMASTTPPPALGRLIQELTGKELADRAEKLKGVAVISDSAFVGSFNWLDGKLPAILVPGRPPRWTPLAVARELPDDNGNFGSRRCVSTRQEFRDANAARYPKHPMEPAIVAALSTAPDLLDEERRPEVVACGSTLGNLLRFVTGQDKTFRILVEAVGGTVFLIRRENSPKDVISNIQGYGHSFPEHYTTWEADIKGSKWHQRMVRYSFGGLRFLVRFGGDGYIAPAGNKAVKTEPASPATLSDVLESLASAGISAGQITADAELQVRKAGDMVGQEHVFDLKTRSIKKRDEDTLGSELPRLWIARLTKFILAFHDRGVFNDIRVMNDISSRVDEWEATNNEALAKLAALVHRIVDLAQARPDKKLELCHSKTGVLEIREQLPEAGDALSAAVKVKWLGSDAESDEESEAKRLRDKAESDEEIKARRVVGVSSAYSDDEDTFYDRWSDKSLDYGYGSDGPGDDFTACSADSCGYCGRCSY